jgi:hypothetical protein
LIAVPVQMLQKFFASLSQISLHFLITATPFQTRNMARGEIWKPRWYELQT